MGHGADRRRALALPALLVVVAALGTARTVTLHQSSWHGVSFGMFATYDNVASRTVRITVDGPAGPFPGPVPADLVDDLERLEVVPTDAGARRVARAVLARTGPGGRRVVVEVRRIHLRTAGGDLRLSTSALARGQAVR